MEESRQIIAIYAPSLRGGGAERVMVSLANGFAERGHSVHLVLASAEGPYFDEVGKRVGIIDLKATRVIKSLPGLIRYLRQARPDAMLSAMWHANAVAVAARILSGVSLHLVISERNNLSASLRHQRAVLGRSVKLLKRWAYPRADRVIAVSGGVADELATDAALPRSSIDVVYNPVVTQGLRASFTDLVEHPWFRPDEPPVILGVGRLEPQKRFADLIKAFSLLRETHDARLMILGEGSLRPELERLARRTGLEDEVLLPGFVHNPFVFMRHAALFALSSGWEGLPNVLIQAMACGSPVVSTDCPSGPDEILEGGKWGRLVPVGDVDALAAAIAATLDEPAHPDVALRGAEFSVDRAVEGYLCALLPTAEDGVA